MGTPSPRRSGLIILGGLHARLALDEPRSVRGKHTSHDERAVEPLRCLCEQHAQQPNTWQRMCRQQPYWINAVYRAGAAHTALSAGNRVRSPAVHLILQRSAGNSHQPADNTHELPAFGGGGGANAPPPSSLPEIRSSFSW